MVTASGPRRSVAAGGCLVSDARLSFRLWFFFFFFFSPFFLRTSPGAREAAAPSCDGDRLQVTCGERRFFGVFFAAVIFACLRSPLPGSRPRPAVAALREGRACHWKGLTVSEPGLKWGHGGRLESGPRRGGGGPWCLCGGKPVGEPLKGLHRKISAPQQPTTQQPGASCRISSPIFRKPEGSFRVALPPPG